MLDKSLQGDRCVVAEGGAHAKHFTVHPAGDRPRMSLMYGGQCAAVLSFEYRLGLDRTGAFLKVIWSQISMYSLAGRRHPLFRLDYQDNMNSAPVCHWNLHAVDDEFTDLLHAAQAQALKPRKRPKQLSALHFPVGGERFRPCLEDVVQFLIRDCGFDYHSGWKQALAEGREAWHGRQVAAVVRDRQEDAVRELKRLGYEIPTMPRQLRPAVASGAEAQKAARW